MAFLTSALSDLDSFLADFGESQTWTPAGGAATPFTGVAEVGYRQIDLASGAVTSHDAAVFGKTSVIGTAKKGDAVSLTSVLNAVSAAAYEVTERQNGPDDLGPGMTRLMLRKS